MLKKLIRANLDDLALCLGVVGGVFLLTHLITAAVLLFLLDNPRDSVLLSGLILPAITGFLLLFVSAAHVGVTFPMALKFSQSRRRALGLTLGLIAFLAVCSMGLAALLTRLEPLFAPGLWAGLTGARSAAVDTVVVGFGSVNTVSQAVPEGRVLSVAAFSLAWYWFVLIAAGGAAAGVIAGALLQRFGRRGFWVLWVVWMLACFSPQILPWKRYAVTNWLWPLVGAAALAALVWSLWSLLHAAVRE